jgi:hypothetical protein
MLPSGRRGREFKSPHPDQLKPGSGPGAGLFAFPDSKIRQRDDGCVLNGLLATPLQRAVSQ